MQRRAGFYSARLPNMVLFSVNYNHKTKNIVTQKCVEK